MDLMLILQILTAFVVGGGVIALLSLLAEKADPKVAGIIMMFPTTIVLGFFFLGMTTSAAEVALVVPATLIPLGIVVFSPVIYIYVAQFYAGYTLSKMQQVIVTLVSSSVIWFFLAAPFAIWKLNHFVIGILGYLVLARLAYVLLNKKMNVQAAPGIVYNRFQLLIRVLFIGFVLSAVVLLGKKLNPFWGGIFTMYPAATFASMILFHYYYEPSQLYYLMRKAPIGSLSLFLYAIMVVLLFPSMGVVTGTVLAYGVSLLFSLFLLRVQQKI